MTTPIEIVKRLAKGTPWYWAFGYSVWKYANWTWWQCGSRKLNLVPDSRHKHYLDVGRLRFWIYRGSHD